jgi:hypothetical protein
MNPSPPTESEGVPALRTGFGRFFLSTAPPKTPKGIDAFIPAVARDHESEMLGISAFAGLWSFAAVGCLLPWGEGCWNDAIQNALCLLVWIPVWFLGLVLCFAVPGAVILPLLHRGVFNKERARRLSTLLACLIFSFIAIVLARSPLLSIQVIGWIWLGALGLEALLIFILLFTRIRR